MARYDDTHSDYAHWSKAKLLREIYRTANLTDFGASMIARDPVVIDDSDKATDFIKSETRSYRDTWLNPLIVEMSRRLNVSPL